MKSPIRFHRWKWVAILFFIFTFNDYGQPNRQHASDFSSVEYFDPPYEHQVHWRISGAEAQPLTGGLLLIKKLKIEEFAETSKTTSIVEAPECLYDRLMLTAHSTGPIELRSGDGKFRVDGNGFLFHQTNSFLTISNNVRTIIISMGIIAAGAMNGPGQTNVMEITNRAPSRTIITSEHGDFEMSAHKAIYYDNVYVDDPKMKLRCERLIADTPENGGRMTHIVCETNVVVDAVDNRGQSHHVTANKAIYDYHIANNVTNETITFTGDARIEDEKMIITSEPIVWDNVGQVFHFTHEKMIFKQSMNLMPTNELSTTPVKTVPGTNRSPAANTNKPPTVK